MDKVLVFGTKDCRFESCQGHFMQAAPFFGAGIQGAAGRTHLVATSSPTMRSAGDSGSWRAWSRALEIRLPHHHARPLVQYILLQTCTSWDWPNFLQRGWHGRLLRCSVGCALLDWADLLTNDSEGIRTPAGRAQWISSPSP